jgi:hypothetical protein
MLGVKKPAEQNEKLITVVMLLIKGMNKTRQFIDGYLRIQCHMTVVQS